jgi:hypothetical protein
MAVCEAQGLLVTSNTEDNTVSVYKLSRDIADGNDGLVLVSTLGGASSPLPMQFKFRAVSG